MCLIMCRLRKTIVKNSYIKVVFDNVQIAQNEREKMHNINDVFDNVQIAKNDCENIHNNQCGKHNVILLY